MKHKSQIFRQMYHRKSRTKFIGVSCKKTNTDMPQLIKHIFTLVNFIVQTHIIISFCIYSKANFYYTDTKAEIPSYTS